MEEKKPEPQQQITLTGNISGGNPKKMKWVCQRCGNIITAKKFNGVCRICGGRSFSSKNDDTPDCPATDESPTAGMQKDKLKKILS